jgi:hypothetical protein
MRPLKRARTLTNIHTHSLTSTLTLHLPMKCASVLEPINISPVLFSTQKFLLHTQRLSQPLGQTQNFHLISLGKNAHPHVPTVAAGVTTVTHTRTPLDTDLTAPPDTSLLPALVTLAGRRHTLPCSWKGQRYDQFSMFSNTRQSGPPWATASSICRAPQSVRVSVDQVIMLTGTAQSRRLRVTREPRMPP